MSEENIDKALKSGYPDIQINIVDGVMQISPAEYGIKMVAFVTDQGSAIQDLEKNLRDAVELEQVQKLKVEGLLGLLIDLMDNKNECGDLSCPCTYSCIDSLALQEQIDAILYPITVTNSEGNTFTVPE